MKAIETSHLRSTWKRYHSYFPPMLEALREDEGERKFWLLATASYKPSLGCECGGSPLLPYNADRLAEHAFWISSFLHSVPVKGVLAQLARPDASWFGQRESKRLNAARHDYLESALRMAKKEKFTGALEFDEIPIRFINLFLDFPYTSKWSDIELLCRGTPLIVRFSHHLTVDFATPHYGLFRRIRGFFKKTNLGIIETLSPRRALEQSRRLDVIFRNMKGQKVS